MVAGLILSETLRTLARISARIHFFPLSRPNSLQSTAPAGPYLRAKPLAARRPSLDIPRATEELSSWEELWIDLGGEG
jgi:hypothetical protein